MRSILLAVAAAGLMAPFAIGGAALAGLGDPGDPGEFGKKQWEKRADCDKKLAEADSAREFRKTLAECNRELAKLSWEQRQEAAKAWRESEKKWRERQRDGYYGGDWDD